MGSAISVTTRLARMRVSSFLVDALSVGDRCAAGIGGVRFDEAVLPQIHAAMP
jgi:hypothetical protein